MTKNKKIEKMQYLGCLIIFVSYIHTYYSCELIIMDTPVNQKTELSLPSISRKVRPLVNLPLSRFNDVKLNLGNEFKQVSQDNLNSFTVDTPVTYGNSHLTYPLTPTKNKNVGLISQDFEEIKTNLFGSDGDNGINDPCVDSDNRFKTPTRVQTVTVPDAPIKRRKFIGNTHRDLIATKPLVLVDFE